MNFISSESGLILHTGDAMIKQKLLGFLSIFGIQYITSKSYILLVNEFYV